MNTIDKVKIRMYRYGLGDCFLLTFYADERKPFNILIDCGVLSRSKEFEARMKEVAENIRKVTENTIDILVATHEHWDHVSGFAQAKSIFQSMNIKKIWLAWTENPKDKFAKSLKKNYSNKLKAIGMAYEKLKAQNTSNFTPKQAEGHQFYLSAFDSFFHFFGFDGDSLFNLNATEDAMDFLRKKHDSDIEFLTPRSDDVIEMDELPGIRIYVLGPPKDFKALKKMNPSKRSSEVYEPEKSLAVGASFISAIGENEDTSKPFMRRCCLEKDEIHLVYKEYFNPKNDWRRIDDDWLYSAGNLAIALDSMVNNTCLVLAFEFIKTGKVLLFPGDAQIGNWLSWSNYEWTVKNNDKKEKVTIDDLFSKTVFYKVGHHGSHNATMKEQGLEKMSNKELIAMIPVDQVMSDRKGWKMPFPPLLEALMEKSKGRVIRIDESYPETIPGNNRDEECIDDLFYDVVIRS